MGTPGSWSFPHGGRREGLSGRARCHHFGMTLVTSCKFSPRPRSVLLKGPVRQRGRPLFFPQPIPAAAPWATVGGKRAVAFAPMAERDRVRAAIQGPVDHADKLLEGLQGSDMETRLRVVIDGWGRGIAAALEELAGALEELRERRGETVPEVPTAKKKSQSRSARFARHSASPGIASSKSTTSGRRFAVQRGHFSEDSS